jgi:hypothetical protein
VIKRDMDNVIAPITCSGISSSDVAGIGAELIDYHNLYTPVLSVGISVRKVGSIFRD